MLVERQGSIDDDNSDRNTVRDFIRTQLEGLGHDPQKSLILIPSALMAEWASQATRTHYATNKASSFIGGLSIPELTKQDSKDMRGWLWIGPENQESEPRRLTVPSNTTPTAKPQRDRFPF